MTRVPGAEHQELAELDDLTTTGTVDCLLPITQNSDAYAALAASTGLHTY